ncbi:hypothetical protein CWC22_022970 [Pseudoalteromonas rubra]|uniref:Uncharacterized protein n=1 Tax=Pseudoalteromonas rubra TaxID=43658 RepID=A0A5S3V221_9GAMM|nr:hypothetical protein [Pseudoalteromonas rubra]QPB85866.1 hypothetical protein CWC22_022970 [Pseudoalteromonas rubra]
MNKLIKILIVLFVVFVLTQLDFGCSAKVKEAHKVVVNTGFDETRNKEHFNLLSSFDNRYILKSLDITDVARLGAIDFYPASFSNGAITYILKFDKATFDVSEMEVLKGKISQIYNYISQFQIEHVDILESESKSKAKFVKEIFSGNSLELYDHTDARLKSLITRDNFEELLSELTKSVSGEFVVKPVLKLAYYEVDNLPYHFELVYQVHSQGYEAKEIRILVNPENKKVMGIFL